MAGLGNKFKVRGVFIFAHDLACPYVPFPVPSLPVYEKVRGSRYVDLDADEAGERLAALSVDEVRCTVTKECQGAYRPRRHGESYPSEPEQSFDVNLVAMKITCKVKCK